MSCATQGCGLCYIEPPWPSIDAGKAIPWVEKRTKLPLAESQTEAIRVALASKVMVITGGPGVGKTTLVNSILKILIAKTVAIALCAPTGRAAKRLSESTGLEAKTIHRLLETDPRTGTFRRNQDEPWAAICSLSTRPQWSMCR
jgi:exodeoxyribonuclease V alpha subunit